MVQLLLEQGSDIEAEDRAGLTALMKAAGSGGMETTELLLDHGAVPSPSPSKERHKSTQ